MQTLVKKIEALVISISVQSSLALIETRNERDDSKIITFHLHPTTPLFTQIGERMGVTAIPVKAKITAYIDSRKPLPMIHPPQITPLLVVVEQPGVKGEVAVGHFGENFYSEQLKLKLHLTDKTNIMNTTGEIVSPAALKDELLIVFYEATTRSMPAQTTPSIIIVAKKDD